MRGETIIETSEGIMNSKSNRESGRNSRTSSTVTTDRYEKKTRSRRRQTLQPSRTSSHDVKDMGLEIMKKEYDANEKRIQYLLRKIDEFNKELGNPSEPPSKK